MRWGAGRTAAAVCCLLSAMASLSLVARAHGLPTVVAACGDQLVGQVFTVVDDGAASYRLACVGVPTAPPLPPPFVFTGFRPTAADLASEPATTLTVMGPLAALRSRQVPERHRPHSRPATAADRAAYRAVLTRFEQSDYRAVVADIPGGFSTVIDHQRATDATRIASFDNRGGLTVTAVEVAGRSFLPAVANAGGPGRENLLVPPHSWFGGAPSIDGVDSTELDPFRDDCDGACRLSVLPTVHGVRHFFVESFHDGDGGFDQQEVDVEVTAGRITAFYDFEPGDDGQVYDTDVPQIYTVIEELPAGERITAPGPSLILDKAQVAQAVARAKERANPPAAPQPPSGCPPGTRPGTHCSYGFAVTGSGSG